jgi:site-specific recombinase XerD
MSGKHYTRDYVREECSGCVRLSWEIDVIGCASRRPRAVDNDLATLKAFFNWCIARDLATANPVAGQALPRRQHATDVR